MKLESRKVENILGHRDHVYLEGTDATNSELGRSVIDFLEEQKVYRNMAGAKINEPLRIAYSPEN